MKRIITFLLACVFVIGLIPEACAETVNNYIDAFPRITKKLNSDVTSDLKVTVRTTSSGSYAVNLPQLSDTEAIIQFFKDGDEISGNDSFDSVNLFLFPSEEYDLTQFTVFTNTMIYLSNDDIKTAEQARTVLNDILEAISDGDSHYDRGEIRYYLAADESILFFAVEDLYPNTSSSDEYDSNDDYFSDDYADAMYAASEVDRNLESVFDHIDNYGRK